VASRSAGDFPARPYSNPASFLGGRSSPGKASSSHVTSKFSSGTIIIFPDLCGLFLARAKLFTCHADLSYHICEAEAIWNSDRATIPRAIQFIDGPVLANICHISTAMVSNNLHEMSNQISFWIR
jgi:hypothetical protein